MIGVGYVRVSTKDQEESGLSLDAQERAIREACDRIGVSDVVIMREVASGGDDDRPVLREAVDRVVIGDADVLIVTKLDRLARSLSGFLRTVEAIERSGGDIVVITEQIDTTSPGGRLMAHVMMAFAQFERELISQRTRAALDERRAQGLRLGRPRAVITDDQSCLIRLMRDRGASQAVIADRVGVSRGVVRRVLSEVL